MNRGGSSTTDTRRLFAALVLSFALLQAFTFLPTAVGAPGDFCDKPGNGNDKKCETPAPTPPPPTPTPTLPPPTPTPTLPPPTPSASPTATPDAGPSPAPTDTPSDPTPAPTPAPTNMPSDPPESASPLPSPSASPPPSPSPKPSQQPTPTVPPTEPATPPPSVEPTPTPVVSPPATDPPVITPPPVETAPPDPTPVQTQPPGTFQPPPAVDPPPNDTEPLAPTETDDPGDRTVFGFPTAGGDGPEGPLLAALSDLDDLAVSVADPKPGVAPSDEATGHAFGLRIPLGSSIGDLARTAGKAVQEFAFPLTLAIAVLLFLLFQGELDRRDPKLAYAPVDSTKDMVSFE